LPVAAAAFDATRSEHAGPRAAAHRARSSGKGLKVVIVMLAPIVWSRPAKFLELAALRP
jgi:hypothetical protein